MRCLLSNRKVLYLATRPSRRAISPCTSPFCIPVPFDRIPRISRLKMICLIRECSSVGAARRRYSMESCNYTTSLRAPRDTLPASSLMSHCSRLRYQLSAYASPRRTGTLDAHFDQHLLGTRRTERRHTRREDLLLLPRPGENWVRSLQSRPRSPACQRCCELAWIPERPSDRRWRCSKWTDLEVV